MFSPPGYRPLAELWGEFLQQRLDAVYHASADYYAGSQFDGNAVRGTPLDICENLFLLVVSSLNPVLASADGHVMKIHDEANDGGDHLFALVPPYQSAAYVEGLIVDQGSLDQGSLDEVSRIGGGFFEPWPGNPDQPELWAGMFPRLKLDLDEIPTEIEETLRFARLPICFERERFLVVEELPSWAQFLTETQNSESIVLRFHGWSICMPDTETPAWNDVLSGKTPLFDDVRRPRPSTGVGRPRRKEDAAAAFYELGLDKIDAPFKQKVSMIENHLGSTVSESTVRRGLREKSDQDPDI